MKQASIIGVGLIGGSFALDLKRHIPEVCVTGIDHNETHLTKALSLGIVDQTGDLNTLVTADLVVLAIPVNAALKVLPKVLDLISSFFGFMLVKKTLLLSKFGDYNQAIMEFGSQQCKPKSPNCELCPLLSSCKAYATGTIKTLPVKLKKTKVTKKYFNFLVVNSDNNTTYLEQRTTKGIWQQLYQFPLIETRTSLSENEFLTHLDGSCNNCNGNNWGHK